ncbi:MAG: TetR/AcrR family transcriptional regulator [Solirubrobacterales bacterium]
MARRAARAQPINTALPKGRKSTQRERLVSGMIAAANRDGYAGASVSAVIEQAGVSRPTFYDYFADRDECFLAAITDSHERLENEIRIAVGEHPSEDAIRATIGAILAFSSEDPARAHFLMNESMAGGPRALDARDQGIAEIEQIIEDAHRHVAPTTAIPDVCPRILIGGIYRLLSPRLRRGEPSLAGLAEDLERWSESYELPVGKHRWRSLEPSSPPPLSPFLPESPQRTPTPLGPGRPGISKEEVAANHRERILYAAAQLAGEKGYTATTIADITRRAGIDGRAFYALFIDKQDVFMTVHELGLQQVMNATSSAFFAGASWPERIWEAGRAFTQFLEQNPLITHVGFVEAHAVGPGAAQRVQDSHIAFAMFLQEGYLHVSRQPPPARAAVEAIISTLFEIVYHQARAGAKLKISGLLGQMTFLCLAPFLGAGETNKFIDRKTAAPRKAQPRRSQSKAGSSSRAKR